jgi:hypothetical protein
VASPSQAPRYRSDVPTWIGFVWTLPNTIVGLALGLLTFQAPRIQSGIVCFDRPRGLTSLMARLNRTAMTVGFVVVSAEPVEGRLLAHEQHHVRQYCAWGPLFIPVYLALSIPYGYTRHPMEVRARRAAGERPAQTPEHTSA